MFSSIEYMFIKNYNFFNKNLSTNDTKLITLLAMDFVNIEKEKDILKKLNLKDYIGASNEFLKWNKSGGKELLGLTRRRKREQDLFKINL